MSMDANVDRVCQRMQDRAWVGYGKYGTTTERKDIDVLGWLTHLQEELMDASIYIERLKQEVALIELARIDQLIGETYVQTVSPERQLPEVNEHGVLHLQRSTNGPAEVHPPTHGVDVPPEPTSAPWDRYLDGHLYKENVGRKY